MLHVMLDNYRSKLNTPTSLVISKMRNRNIQVHETSTQRLDFMHFVQMSHRHSWKLVVRSARSQVNTCYIPYRSVNNNIAQYNTMSWKLISVRRKCQRVLRRLEITNTVSQLFTGIPNFHFIILIHPETISFMWEYFDLSLVHTENQWFKYCSGKHACAVPVLPYSMVDSM
jgi:hypothetical protein